jgi:hypothetical protein
VGEIYRVLKLGGRLIVMFYHRNSAVYRLWIPLRRRATGKSMQQLVNEMDGVGNPKGDVYSRAELQGLLAQFEDVEMFADLLKRWHLGLPSRVWRFVPDWLLRTLAPRIGWFLYAKGNKPRAAI